MTQTATIYAAKIGEITALDLLAGFADAPDGALVELYTATVYGDNALQIMFFPEIGRVGICANGNSDWADYGDVESAVNDYLNDRESFEARN